MLIVGPPIEPGSAEEYSMRLAQPLDVARAQIQSVVRDAMRDEALKCAKDVCPYCRDVHRSWCTHAQWHDEMNEFYHFNANDAKIVAAQCDARAIWRRLRAEDAQREPKRYPLGRAGVSIGGGAATIFPPMTGAAQPPDPAMCSSYILEHCDACSGGGMNKRIKDTPCSVCGGSGKMLRPK